MGWPFISRKITQGQEIQFKFKFAQTVQSQNIFFECISTQMSIDDIEKSK